VLPAGIRVLETTAIPMKSPSLTTIMEQTVYRLTFPAALSLDLAACVEQFLARETYPCHREKKGKRSEFDLRSELADLTVSGNTLQMTAGRGKPLEFASAITGLPVAELKDVRIEKLQVIFKDSSLL
jgi:radical SAM-linked protein